MAPCHTVYSVIEGPRATDFSPKDDDKELQVVVQRNERNEIDGTQNRTSKWNQNEDKVRGNWLRLWLEAREPQNVTYDADDEYAWERAYERTWEDVEEDEYGRLRASEFLRKQQQTGSTYGAAARRK